MGRACGRECYCQLCCYSDIYVALQLVTGQVSLPESLEMNFMEERSWTSRVSKCTVVCEEITALCCAPAGGSTMCPSSLYCSIKMLYFDTFVISLTVSCHINTKLSGLCSAKCNNCRSDKTSIMLRYFIRPPGGLPQHNLY